MNEQEMRDGQERVRQHLIVPLADLLHLRRPRKVKTEAAHMAALADICKRLWYLTEDDLLILRETIVRTLTPEAEWPAAAVIIGWANALRARPEGSSPRVVNLVRWAAAKEGIDDAILPALYRWLQAHNRVPQSVDMRTIASSAMEEARWFDRMLEVRGRGDLSSAEAARFRAIEADRAQVAEILSARSEVA